MSSKILPITSEEATEQNDPDPTSDETKLNPVVMKPVVALSRKEMKRHAKSKAVNTRFGNAKTTIWNTSIQDLGQLGIGVELYFIFLKYMSILFTLISISVIPSLMLTSSGNGFLPSEIDGLGIGRFTIGNLGLHPDLNTSSDCLPNGKIDCTSGFTDSLNHLTQDPVEASWIIAMIDLAYCALFLVFILSFQRLINRVIIKNDLSNVTPADYAIQVEGFPVDACEEDVLEHFNSLYDPTKTRHRYPMWLGAFGKRKYLHPVSGKYQLDEDYYHSDEEEEESEEEEAELEDKPHEAEVSTIPTAAQKPVQNLDHVRGNDMYLDKWVAQVTISYDTKGLLRKLMSMERLTRKIKTKEAILDMYTRKTVVDPKREEKLRHKLSKLQTKLERNTISLKSVKKEDLLFDVHSVFVVFQSVESKDRCMDDYRTSRTSWGRYFQPTSLRYQGKYALKVEDAPEPSNVIWENLEVSWRERWIRQSITFLVTIFVLVLSGILLFNAQKSQREFKARQLPPNICDQVLPAIAWGSNDLPSSYHIEWIQASNISSCPEEKYHFQYFFEDNNSSQALSAPAFPPTDDNLKHCTDRCISPVTDTEPHCGSLTCFREREEETLECTAYRPADVITCYCKSRLAQVIAETGVTSGPSKMWNEDIPCQPYLLDFMRQNLLIFIAAFSVVVINAALRVLFRKLAKFERHSSESMNASVVTIKLFFASFLNTALIMLLLNARVPYGVLGQVFTGDFHDFQREWYAAVGVPIATTMVINTFALQVGPLAKFYIIQPIVRWFKMLQAVTQDQMTLIYEGPSFDISLRFSQVLNCIFVAMMYGGGIPILFPIAALTCWITYITEKFTIIRLYTVRVAYDESGTRMATSLLYWALFLHLCCSLWMYGNSEVMPSSSIDFEELRRALGMSTRVFNHEKFMDQLAKVDPLGEYGLLPKILRSHVLPFVLVLILYCVGAILLKAGHNIFYPILNRTLGVILRCLFRSSSSASSSSSHAPEELMMPMFTGPFVQKVPKSYNVGDHHKEAGYRLTYDNQNPRARYVTLSRIWTTDTVFYHGAIRTQGQARLSWESFESPVKTYAIDMNEKYKNAAHALKKLQAKIDQNLLSSSEEEDSGSDSGRSASSHDDSEEEEVGDE